MRKIRINFQTKIIIMSAAFNLIITVILGLYSSRVVVTTLETKIGENALNVIERVKAKIAAA